MKNRKVSKQTTLITQDRSIIKGEIYNIINIGNYGGGNKTVIEGIFIDGEGQFFVGSSLTLNIPIDVLFKELHSSRLRRLLNE